MDRLEIEPDPAEEEHEMVPRDLRERRNWRNDLNRALTTILPLTALALLAMFGISTLHASSAWNKPQQKVDPQSQSHPSTNTMNKRNAIQILAGFDGSEALGAKRSNVTFKDVDGTPKEPLRIFRDHGYSYSRLRVMVGPSGSHGLFQDVEYVKEMARDIVLQNSMKLLLDFHYSHWWADPENQQIPLDWRENDSDKKMDCSSGDNHDRPPNKCNVSLSDLKEHVYNHTKMIMEELIAQGTIPNAVQIGNEVNAGMLWDEGKIKNGDMRNFVQLTNAALGAMKDAFVTSKVEAAFPQIVMHLAAGGWVDYSEEWFTNFTRAGGEFDIIGLSYYPFWHGSLQDLSDNMKNLKSVFPDKSVWVVESAYYWTETSSNFDTLPFDQSEDGQFAYLDALLNVLRDYNHDTAVFYWGSHWTQGKLWMKSNESWEEAENRSLFNNDAQALKGIDALVDRLQNR